VRSALREIEELVGRVDSEEILDSIFSNFCIGK
jgi:tRNA U34 5-carboxymethylaminomethyl modifying GTPase MnmE/TrmE